MDSALCQTFRRGLRRGQKENPHMNTRTIAIAALVLAVIVILILVL
jgi:hypothetical protein